MARRTSTARVRELAPVIDLTEARSRRAARSVATPETNATSTSLATSATISAVAPILRLPLPPTPAAPAAKARGGVRRHFGELRDALADGWEIVQPIFARPLWNVPDNSATAFNFVLRRAGDTRLVTVPDGRTIARFIRDRQLTVDYRR